MCRLTTIGQRAQGRRQATLGRCRPEHGARECPWQEVAQDRVVRATSELNLLGSDAIARRDARYPHTTINALIRLVIHELMACKTTCAN